MPGLVQARGLLAVSLAVLLTLAISTSAAALSPRKAFDLNPNPKVVEVALVAFPRKIDFGKGNRTEVWTYNGQLPGPTIQGNRGDTLIVHFWNLLPEATTIHWHGVDLPANMDGSNIAQNPVPPGGYFRYEFKLNQVSMFWYHPHIRSHEQVEKGLYGSLIIRDRIEDKSLGIPRLESTLVLDDILLDEDGQVAEPFPTDPLENAEAQVNGREGNVLLVNGRQGRKSRIRSGRPRRLRVVNTANSRMMRISMAGHSMWRIGGDGGLLEEAVEVPPIGQVPDPDDPSATISDPDLSKGLILSPGERADLVFTPTGRQPIDLEWHDYARGRHSVFTMPTGAIGLGDAEDDGKRPPETLMTFLPDGRKKGRAWVPPATLREVERIDVAGATPLPLMFGHTPPDANGDVTFFVQMKNGMPLPFDAVMPEDAHTVAVGDTHIWEVNNLTAGDHNFHTHGFSFQPIELQFVDMDTPENNSVVPFDAVEVKDTILMPKRPGARGRSRTILRAAVHFDDTGREGQTEAFGKLPGETTSGGWLLHCHLLEHAARGMMSFFQVLNP
jgi:FtsP/CotA-like multicopper oxidase with cupredoxin domain